MPLDLLKQQPRWKELSEDQRQKLSAALEKMSPDQKREFYGRIGIPYAGGTASTKTGRDRPEQVPNTVPMLNAGALASGTRLQKPWGPPATAGDYAMLGLAAAPAVLAPMAAAGGIAGTAGRLATRPAVLAAGAGAGEMIRSGSPKNAAIAALGTYTGTRGLGGLARFAGGLLRPAGGAAGRAAGRVTEKGLAQALKAAQAEVAAETQAGRAAAAAAPRPVVSPGMSSSGNAPIPFPGSRVPAAAAPVAAPRTVPAAAVAAPPAPIPGRVPPTATAPTTGGATSRLESQLAQSVSQQQALPRGKIIDDIQRLMRGGQSKGQITKYLQDIYGYHQSGAERLINQVARGAPTPAGVAQLARAVSRTTAATPAGTAAARPVADEMVEQIARWSSEGVKRADMARRLVETYAPQVGGLNITKAAQVIREVLRNLGAS